MRVGRDRFRVIGGVWRSRRLSFAPIPGLRPTPDRVRETLFNWLAPTMAGSRCLDLFAGSGALGIEALSRGAAGATFVERDPRAAGEIRRQLDRLGASAEVACEDVLQWLDRPGRPFDVVLVDPPYGQALLRPALQRLVARGWLAPSARVYVEAEQPAGSLPLPAPLVIVKAKHAGRVHFGLARAARGGSGELQPGGPGP